MTDDPGRFVLGHCIERTSLTGEAFSGTCSRCGRHGLTIDDMFNVCDQIRRRPTLKLVVNNGEQPT